MPRGKDSKRKVVGGNVEVGSNADTPLLFESERTVVKSGLVKLVCHKMGRNQWKLRNMELFWEKARGEQSDPGICCLRLVIFPAKSGQAHKRCEIPLRSAESLQIASPKFPGKHVMLIQADVDYYLNVETENGLIDWVATLKAAIAKANSQELYRVTILPGQAIQPGGEALMSFKDKSLVLQRPVNEEMFYGCKLSNICSFGGNPRKLNCWYRVVKQDHMSHATAAVQLLSFSTTHVMEIIDGLCKQMSDFGIAVEEGEGEDDEIIFNISQGEIGDIVPSNFSQLPWQLSVGNNLKVDHSTDDSSFGVRRVTWSGQEVRPPQELIQQLRNRRMGEARSQTDLTAGKPAPPQRRDSALNQPEKPAPATRHDLSPANQKEKPVPPVRHDSPINQPEKPAPLVRHDSTGYQPEGVSAPQPRKESALAAPVRPALVLPDQIVHPRLVKYPPSVHSPPASPPHSPAPSPASSPELSPFDSLSVEEATCEQSPRRKPQKPRRSPQARARHSEILSSGSAKSPTGQGAIPSVPEETQPVPRQLSKSVRIPSAEDRQPSQSLKPRPAPRARAKTNPESSAELNNPIRRQASEPIVNPLTKNDEVIGGKQSMGVHGMKPQHISRQQQHQSPRHIYEGEDFDYDYMISVDANGQLVSVESDEADGIVPVPTSERRLRSSSDGNDGRAEQKAAIFAQLSRAEPDGVSARPSGVPCPQPRAKGRRPTPPTPLTPERKVLPPRGPPDGMEDLAAVSDDDVDSAGEEPIYVNLPSHRLPLAGDSSNDEL